MASATSSMDVEEEFKCPICKEFLKNPVTLDCGHNFCKGCISQYCEKWEDMEEDLECALCKAKIKKRNFRQNWQLANIVEKVHDELLFLRKENLCVRHKEKLHLFCKEDKKLVCVICEKSPEHRSHSTQVLEEAAKECRDQLSSHLEVLRTERETILASKEGTEKESQDLLEQIEEKKSKTVAVFNQVHQFLEEQKTVLLSQFEELKEIIMTRREETMARLMKKLTSQESLIEQMEEKCQQPASELLQDIRRTLERYEKKEVFENPVAFPPVLIDRIKGVFDVKPLLKGVMNLFPAKVTLDPDTAHPIHILSKDRKSVRWGDKRQDLPNNPERFEWPFVLLSAFEWPFVLGSEGFTSGRHFWEVTVGREGYWAVGVSRKSVRRKGLFSSSPKEGIWAVGNWEGKYRVLNPPDFTRLSLSQELKRIRVTLDCDEREVSFSDADSGVHVHTFSGASFRGETLLPFFWVYGEAHLSLSL